MFLLFHNFLGQTIINATIYIPICFYYFGVGEYVRSRVYNLHSNMFLLFHILFQKSNPCDVIYIPICFYYFFSSKIFNKMERRIYIPICFYYFLFLGSPVLLSTRFTFQYVSIISFHTPSMPSQ